MENLKGVIYTQEICLLCLKNTDGDDQVVKRSFASFKLLFRYLEVDMRKVIHYLEPLFPPDFLQNIEAIGKDVGGLLCEKCSSLMNEFLEWYGHFESARLCLDSCVQSLYSVLAESERCGERLEEYQEKFDANGDSQIAAHFKAADSLRKETIRKCSVKLLSWPRVKLNKIDNPLPMDYTHTEEAKMDNSDSESFMEMDPDHEQPLRNEETTVFDLIRDDNTHLEDSTGNPDLPLATPDSSQLNSDKDVFIPPQSNLPDQSSSSLNKENLQPQTWDETTSCTEINEFSHTSTEVRYICAICPKQFAQRDLFQYHYVMVHTFTYLMNWMPPETTENHLKSAVKRGVFRGKVILDDNNSPIEYGCPHCSLKFEHWGPLKYHLLLNHYEDIVKAVINRKSDTSNSSNIESLKPVIQHDQIQTNERIADPIGSDEGHKKLEADPNAQYVCNFCSHGHALKHNLQLHKELSHTFPHFKELLPPNTTKEELKSALKRILSRTIQFKEEKLFGCHQCGARFSSRSSVKTHLLRKHFSSVYSEVANGNMEFINY